MKEIDGPKPYERVKDNDELAATRAVALTIWRFFSNFFSCFFLSSGLFLARDSIVVGVGAGFALSYFVVKYF